MYCTCQRKLENQGLLMNLSICSDCLINCKETRDTHIFRIENSPEKDINFNNCKCNELQCKCTQEELVKPKEVRCIDCGLQTNYCICFGTSKWTSHPCSNLETDNVDLSNLDKEHALVCNKTTLRYTSDSAKNKYFIPKTDVVRDEDLYCDKRNALEIMKDISLKLYEIISPHLASLWRKIVKYRIERKQISDDGYHIVKEELQRWIKQYKNENLSEEDKKVKETAIKELKKKSPHKIPEADYYFENKKIGLSQYSRDGARVQKGMSPEM